MKNAILIGHTKSKIPIDGSLSNAFEYFYYIWNLTKNINLIIDCSEESLNIVKIYLKKKYNIDEKCFNDIKVFKRNLEFYNVLFLFEMICIDNYDLKYNNIKAKEIYALSGSNKHTLDVRYFCDNQLLIPSGKNYIEYRSKIYFEIMKEPKVKAGITFYNTRSKKYDDKFTRKNLDIFNNIFEQFNKMIYIQDPCFFDVKPRLFQECMYFDTPFEFIPHPKCFDGANLRYNDFDLESRRFNENDEIVKLLV